MNTCYICNKVKFGKCEFLADSKSKGKREFDLCEMCFNNFIQAFEVSRITIEKTKGNFNSIINSKDKEIGDKLLKIIKESEKK